MVVVAPGASEGIVVGLAMPQAEQAIPVGSSTVRPLATPPEFVMLKLTTFCWPTTTPWSRLPGFEVSTGVSGITVRSSGIATVAPSVDVTTNCRFPICVDASAAVIV